MFLMFIKNIISKIKWITKKALLKSTNNLSDKPEKTFESEVLQRSFINGNYYKFYENS